VAADHEPGALNLLGIILNLGKELLPPRPNKKGKIIKPLRPIISLTLLLPLLPCQLPPL
jgi:hypothetical protein